jgi:uroporphyrinogen-III synthase
MAGNLNNRTIVITRGQGQAENLATRVLELGGKIVLFPTIEISATENRRACVSAAADINQYDWVVFSSGNAVRYFHELTGSSTTNGMTCKIAAVGEQTARELENKGITVNLTPETFRASALVKALESLDLRGKKVLFPASNLARDEIPDGLRSLGAIVDRVEVYQTGPNRDLNGNTMRRMIARHQVDCLTFCSPSAIRFFLKIVGDSVVQDINNGDLVVGAIGPTTYRAVEMSGMDNIIMPEQSLEDKLIAVIVEYFDNLQ